MKSFITLAPEVVVDEDVELALRPEHFPDPGLSDRLKFFEFGNEMFPVLVVSVFLDHLDQSLEKIISQP